MASDSYGKTTEVWHGILGNRDFEWIGLDKGLWIKCKYPISHFVRCLFVNFPFQWVKFLLRFDDQNASHRKHNYLLEKYPKESSDSYIQSGFFFSLIFWDIECGFGATPDPKWLQQQVPKPDKYVFGGRMSWIWISLRNQLGLDKLITNWGVSIFKLRPQI